MKNGIAKYYWFVVSSGLLSGLVIFMGQVFANLKLSLFEISTLPFLGSVVILTPVILFWREHRYTGKNISALFLYGAVSLILTFVQFTPVVLGVPVAIAVLLLYTQPLWTVIISWLILKESIGRREIFACLIVLLGVFVLVNPLHSAGNFSTLGIIFALLGGIFLSGWVTIGSYLSKRGNDPINTLFTEKFFSFVCLMALFPLFNKLISDPAIVHFTLNWSLRVWLLLIFFSLVVQIINHWFYLSGTKKVPTADAGIIMLLEPLVGAILAALFLNQPITLGIIFGGALILLANYLVIMKTKT